MSDSNRLTAKAVACAALLVSGMLSCSSSDSNDGDGQVAADGGGDGLADNTAQDAEMGTSDTKPTGEGPLSEAELTRITAKLASDELQGREEGSQGGAAARQFIIEELTRCGVKPAGEGGTFEQKITTGEGTNILGIIEGTGDEEKKRKVLISAHYDHFGVSGGEIYNGAYDNAAAVALLIGVACELATKPPLRSVLVASWDAEEPPTFLTDAMGSQFYVDHPLVPLAETDVAIVLDLIAADPWPGFDGHFVLGAELTPQIASAVDVAQAPAGLVPYRLGMHIAEEQPTGHQPWGDYDAFRNAGVPFLFLSDAQTKVYHTPDDDIDHLVTSRLPLEAAYLLSIVDRLANAPASEYVKPTFDAGGSDYPLDAANLELLLTRALQPGGIVDALGLAATSKTKLEADLAAVKEVNGSLKGGGKATEAAVRALRTAGQRLMCLAGSSYPETVCLLF